MAKQIAEKKSLEEMLAAVTLQTDKFLRTGCLSFDLLMGGQGLLLGASTQVFSDTGYGKTTLCLAIAKGICAQNKDVLFAEVEPNGKLVADMGLADDPHFHRYPLTTYTELGELTDAFMRSNYTLLIVDSLSACQQSKADFAAIEDRGNFGADAMITQNYTSLLQGVLKGTEKAVIFINQIRAIVGQTNPYGPKTDADGAYATKFYPAVRLTILGDTKAADVSDGTTIVGKVGTLFAIKNRGTAPFVHIPYNVLFGKGVSNLYVLLYFCQWAGYMTIGNGGNVTFNLPGESQPIYVKGKPARNEVISNHYDALVELFYERAEEFFRYLQSGPKLLPLV